MRELKLPESLKKSVRAFVEDLKQLYREELVSVILYGSAASDEFAEAHSNVNVLVVLENTELTTLEAARKLVNRRVFRRIEPLFLSREYLSTSSDVFPIEFLDMQENYHCLHGPDVLKKIKVGLKNLRFQCEQELKSKLIILKQQYLAVNPRDREALARLLFKGLTSVLHILRNVVRLKGKEPAYNKEDLLRQVAAELRVEVGVFLKILGAKKKAAAPPAVELKTMLNDFARELEKIAKIVDKL